ncbi:alpha-beta hydrolase superfamily lysophospholipase [Diaminobutyricimonas aerilata]|uniref:Alpha-beta hydrolase superfamily lysophospholipase n=1 Tax=Diaminobutyricimonas aerilata TaxID=1162967 RepID=A0A2M9CNR0_9MICO|nr:alpha/beta fold hydrolase [Diaminobutyricimonas aerilata]PJJ73504.1 alpha-beta hydrolase superfamily lysophospholipase [Diaminobutyricimonas aerilata]
MHVAQYHPEARDSVLFVHGGNVAGWMWHEQAEALPDHHAIVPDLPGFGGSADEPWTDLADVADRLADLIREHGHDGRAHVVGLSLGAVLAVVLTARHPNVVRSTLVTGAIVDGVRGLTRHLGLLQLRMWGSPAYWKATARAFRLPADAVDEFVRTGLGIDRSSATRLMRQVYDGVPAVELDRLRDAAVPLLAIAGGAEPRLTRDSFPSLSARSSAVVTRIAPRMHHQWSAEDPELFHRVLAHWLRTGEPSPELAAP